MGILLVNLELEKVSLDKVIVLENIYYDYNSDEICVDVVLELDKVIILLKDNLVLFIELGFYMDFCG